MAGIKKNFIYNVSYQILNILVPLVTIPYLSRILGPELVGVYSYTYSITNYFVLFAVCGMSTYGVRAIARAGEDRRERSKVFWSAFLSQAIIGVTTLLIYILYGIFFHEGGLAITFIWGFWVISAVVDVSWLLFGCNEFKTPTIRSFVTRLLQLISIFIFVKDANDLTIYIFIISIGFLINQLLLLPFIRKYIDIYKPTWKEITSHFIPNLRLFLPVLAVSLYTTLDKIMLGAMSNMTETGYFEYAEKISRLPLTAITALGTVMLPAMSQILADGKRERAIALLGKSMWVMLAIAYAFMFGIIAVVEEFVPIFFGEGFLPAIPLMILLSIIIPVISVTNVIGKQYLLPSMRDNQYTASVAIGALVNVLINVALIPRYAALGAAVGTVAAEIAVLVVQLFFVRGQLPVGRYFLGSLPFLISGACMLVLVRLFADLYLAGHSNSVWLLLSEIFGGALIYLIIGACISIFIKNEYIMSILYKIKSKF